MRCEACHGRGAIWVANPGPPLGFPSLAGGALQVSGDGGAVELTCPECNGCGIAHCCDGICTQPQADFP